MEIHTKYASLAALIALLQTTINCQNNFLLRAALDLKWNVRKIHFLNAIPEKNVFACQNKNNQVYDKTVNIHYIKCIIFDSFFISGNVELLFLQKCIDIAVINSVPNISVFYDFAIGLYFHHLIKRNLKKGKPIFNR